METIVDNILISLNSKYGIKKNDTYLSEISFPFTGILTPDKTIKRAFISLQNATIPISFYIINETNNRLVLKDLAGGLTYNIDVDYGNYSASTLIIELQAKINAGFPYPCSILFNKNTGKLTFTFSGSVQIRNTSTMDDILGTGGSDLSTNGSNRIFMPYPLSLLGTKKLTIKSQALDIASFDAQTGNIMNIIATIPVTETFYGLLTYVPATETKFLLTTNYLNEIDIRITDEDNNDINFNNVNWSMTLCLSIERFISVSQENDIQSYIMKQPQDATSIQENVSMDEPSHAVEKLVHQINEPETLSDSIKQFSEAMLRGSNNYTAQFRDLIKIYGDNVIVKMEVKRSPVRKMVVKALDYISLGAFEKNNPYDTLFHLYISLTLDDGNILRLEKNSVLTLKVNTNDDAQTESMLIEYPKETLMTLNTLLEKTRQQMGKRYFLYNAKGNNCQDFLRAVLVSNNLGNSEEIDFIKQSTREIFNKSPDYLRRVALFTTNARAGIENTKSSVYDLWKHKTDLHFLTR